MQNSHIRIQINTVFLSALAICSTAVMALASDTPETAMNAIQQRYYNILVKPQSVSESLEQDLLSLSQLGPDGQWPDLDLSKKDNTKFPGLSHLGRITKFYRQLAVSGDAKWREAAERALLAHQNAAPRSYNWWQNEIGMPLEAVNLLVIAKGNITSDLREYALSLTANPLSRDENRKSTFTGQNLLWRCRIALIKGCIQKDAKLVAQAAKEISSLIIIEDGEGIQIDGSFHQHGPQIYSHGYGRAFTVDTSTLAALLDETPWQLSAKHFDVLAVHSLGGQQLMMRGMGLDFHPMGREITRVDRASANRYLDAVERLAKIDSGNAKEYTKWLARMQGQAAPLELNRHFWRSDYFVHHRKDFYFSVRMASKRTRLIERVNAENLIGAALSAGTCCLMRSGQEYQNVFPLWDWTKLPGATTDELVSLDKVPYGTNGQGDFVGGASDGHYGIAAMIMEKPIHTRLKAKKAYMAFDEGVLCLGTDITGGKGPAYTGVQQSWLNGAVQVDGKNILPGEYKIDNSHSVSHNGIRYEFAEDQKVRLCFGQRSGSWKQISRSASDEVVSGEVFGLWLDHGELNSPASYSYTILSEAAAGKENPLVVLRNDSSVQAAMHSKNEIVQAVFYDPDELKLPDGATIKPDQPCILIAVPNNGTLRTTVADPTQMLKQITLTINGTSRKIALPQGNMAGSSVTIDW